VRLVTDASEVNDESGRRERRRATVFVLALLVGAGIGDCASAAGFSAQPIDLTAQQVSQLFPKSAKSNVDANWTILQNALRVAGMAGEPQLVIYALATVRAETTNFSATSEKSSKYSQTLDRPSYAGISAPAALRPFGAYDSSLQAKQDGKVVVNKHLGNKYYPGIDEQLMRSRHGDPPNVDTNDGERYRGRGFIQLTGKYNYTKMQEALRDTTALNIVDDPDSAGVPETAARILVGYISLHQTEIESDMARKDYLAARKVVNGAALGMKPFLDLVQHFRAN